MATGTIILPLLGMVPDGTNPPDLEFASGTLRPYWAFDGGSVTESGIWTFQMPGDYSSGLTANLIWSGSSSTTTSHTAQWQISVMALTPETDSVATDTDSYDTANTGADDILGTTASRPQALSISLTNDDSVTADDYVAIQIERDPTVGVDDLPI